MKTCLCNVDGWLMFAIPGTSYFIGSKRYCWGPYTKEESEFFLEGGNDREVKAEIAFCSCEKQASFISGVKNTPDMCIHMDDRCFPKCLDCISKN